MPNPASEFPSRLGDLARDADGVDLIEGRATSEKDEWSRLIVDPLIRVMMRPCERKEGDDAAWRERHGLPKSHADRHKPE
jgi:hypothetical protein